MLPVAEKLTRSLYFRSTSALWDSRYSTRCVHLRSARLLFPVRVACIIAANLMGQMMKELWCNVQRTPYSILHGKNVHRSAPLSQACECSCCPLAPLFECLLLPFKSSYITQVCLNCVSLSDNDTCLCIWHIDGEIACQHTLQPALPVLVVCSILLELSDGLHNPLTTSGTVSFCVIKTCFGHGLDSARQATSVFCSAGVVTLFHPMKCDINTLDSNKGHDSGQEQYICKRELAAMHSSCVCNEKSQQQAVTELVQPRQPLHLNSSTTIRQMRTSHLHSCCPGSCWPSLLLSSVLNDAAKGTRHTCSLVLLCGCARRGEAALLCGGESALLDAGARPCDVKRAVLGA